MATLAKGISQLSMNNLQVAGKIHQHLLDLNTKPCTRYPTGSQVMQTANDLLATMRANAKKKRRSGDRQKVTHMQENEHRGQPWKLSHRRPTGTASHRRGIAPLHPMQSTVPRQPACKRCLSRLSLGSRVGFAEPRNRVERASRLRDNDHNYRPSVAGHCAPTPRKGLLVHLLTAASLFRRHDDPSMANHSLLHARAQMKRC